MGDEENVVLKQYTKLSPNKFLAVGFVCADVLKTSWSDRLFSCD